MLFFPMDETNPHSSTLELPAYTNTAKPCRLGAQQTAAGKQQRSWTFPGESPLKDSVLPRHVTSRGIFLHLFSAICSDHEPDNYQTLTEAVIFCSVTQVRMRPETNKRFPEYSSHSLSLNTKNIGFRGDSVISQNTHMRLKVCRRKDNAIQVFVK